MSDQERMTEQKRRMRTREELAPELDGVAGYSYEAEGMALIAEALFDIRDLLTPVCGRGKHDLLSDGAGSYICKHCKRDCSALVDEARNG